MQAHTKSQLKIIFQTDLKFRHEKIRTITEAVDSIERPVVLDRLQHQTDTVNDTLIRGASIALVDPRVKRPMDHTLQEKSHVSIR